MALPWLYVSENESPPVGCTGTTGYRYRYYWMLLYLGCRVVYRSSLPALGVVSDLSGCREPVTLVNKKLVNQCGLKIQLLTEFTS